MTKETELQKKIEESVTKRVVGIELSAYKKSCRTAMIAFGMVAGLVAKYITDNSKQVFDALYVLFYGKMP